MLAEIDIRTRDILDLQADLRALRAMTRITGSTPEMTRLIRRGREQMITAIVKELARRKVADE